MRYEHPFRWLERLSGHSFGTLSLLRITPTPDNYEFSLEARLRKQPKKLDEFNPQLYADLGYLRYSGFPAQLLNLYYQIEAAAANPEGASVGWSIPPMNSGHKIYEIWNVEPAMPCETTSRATWIAARPHLAHVPFETILGRLWYEGSGALKQITLEYTPTRRRSS